MTMLDRMRRHKNWLKWSLAIVCLAFVVFYVPAFLVSREAASADVVASVDGREISTSEFRKAYQRQLSDYRARFGGNVSDQLLRQLGIDQQILQQMIDEQTIISAAARAGITVTDTEVAQRILTLPEFQENGQFIGQDRYEALLRMQRTPISTDEFEESVRRRLIVQKMQAALTSWMTVADDEVGREYRRKNEKVKLDVLVFNADKFRSDVSVSDAEVSSYFDSHKEQYRVGERRKVRYLLVDADAMRSKVVVPSRDIERFYNENIEMFTTPEQVRASHILFKTNGKNDAEVKAKAEKVLKEAKGGADFAALAKKYSEDEASAKQGGDLDYFGKGRMVPEFDQVAFAMEPGQTSDLVKTQFGYHIIKLADKKPEVRKTFDEARPQILDQLTNEQAQIKAADEAEAIEKEIKGPADLDTAAASRGLKVQESGYFTKDQPIMGLGPTPEGVADVFQLKENQVTGLVRVGRGYAFMALVAGSIQPPHLPKPDEVKNTVHEDLVRQKTKDVARQKAAALAAGLKGNGDLAKAAKAAGLEVKTTELIARESAIPEIGISPQVDQVAFALPVGAVSDPIVTDNGVAIVRVVERKDPTPAEAAADRDKTREQLLNERRNQFFSAYMIKARQAMKISINREAVQKVIG
jgi:peptidyl-prolyl cis-trans isomerase D